MTDQDDEIPAYIEIIQRPPLDYRLSDERIIKEFRIRLEALFERYDHIPRSRDESFMVLGMALDHIAAFQIRKRFKPPALGAPKKDDRYMFATQARSELRRLKKAAGETGGSVKGLAMRAAEIVHRRNRAIENRARRKHEDDPAVLRTIIKTPSVKTIRNLMSQKIAFPYSPDPSIDRAERLLWEAYKAVVSAKPQRPD